MMARNSDRTGSCASVAITRMQSPSGRPARTPRTITSIAFGNSSRNLLMRRFLRDARTQRGKPREPANKPSQATAMLPVMPNKERPSTTPATALAITK
jgi:hypothetical protein